MPAEVILVNDGKMPPLSDETTFASGLAPVPPVGPDSLFALPALYRITFNLNNQLNAAFLYATIPVLPALLQSQPSLSIMLAHLFQMPPEVAITDKISQRVLPPTTVRPQGISDACWRKCSICFISTSAGT